MTTKIISSAVTGSVAFGSYSTITVTSLGNITSPSVGVTGQGVLINSGTVSGSSNGVHVYGNGVTNEASAFIQGRTAGIYGYGTITNAGTISGGTYAIELAAARGNEVVVDPGAVFIGTVKGGGGGNALEFADGATDGTFFGLGSHYVNFGQVSVAGSWTVAGVNTLAAGQTLTDAAGVQSIGNFTNAGVVIETKYSGAIAQVGQTFVNVGLVTTARYYVLRVFGGGLITNAATARIMGNEGGAVQVDGTVSGTYVNGATLVNAGLITGWNGGGVYVDGGGVVTNLASGTIMGAFYGIDGRDSTVINAGTIAVGGATNDAVKLGAGSNARVVVDPGAVFVGTVDGFNTIGATAVSTLEFASGSSSGTFSGLGSQYVNFAQISIDAEATWTAGGTNTVVAGQTLTDSGALTFAAAPVGGGSLVFAGHGITLASEGAGSFGPTIGGLLGNTIELLGVTESFTSLNGQNLTLSGGTALTLTGTYSASQMGVTNAGGNTFIVACFDTGTTIATARGPVEVEELSVGERVLCVSGRLAAVRWIGHRRVDLRRHARPDEVMPVRVLAGALGDGVPVRDLVLSPDHAVWLDGYLVPVRYLINGRSIVAERRERVTYWHVELDRHDLVLAEGLACESYLDTGNREAFEGEAAMALHPAFGRDHALAVWERQACAPILFDPAEPALRALHTGLLARAERVAQAA